MFILRLDFWASQYIIRLESQSLSLDDLGKPLSSVNISRPSPNFCNWSGYSSLPTRLPPIAGLQTLARGTKSICYLYNTTYWFEFNDLLALPGSEPGSPEPKVATLPLCYTPLTVLITFINIFLAERLFAIGIKQNKLEICCFLWLVFIYNCFKPFVIWGR